MTWPGRPGYPPFPDADGIYLLRRPPMPEPIAFRWLARTSTWVPVDEGEMEPMPPRAVAAHGWEWPAREG